MKEFKDLIVLVPGVMGSVLSRGDEELWAANASVAWRAIRSGGSALDSLRMDHPDSQRIRATRLMPDATLVPGFFKIDGYTKSARVLCAKLDLRPGANFREFAYDWRQDNGVSATQLAERVREWLDWWRADSGNADARVSLVCHSMGGLVARHFTEVLGGWQVTRNLFTIGTPHRGSLNALRFLEEGMKGGIGPLGIDLSPLLRSYPSVHQLLPTFRCIHSAQTANMTVQDALQSGQLRHVRPELAEAASDFHARLQSCVLANRGVEGYPGAYVVRPIVGVEQPTSQGAYLVDEKLVFASTFDGDDLRGDGTVPRPSATPQDLVDARREVFVAEAHGSLQNNDTVLEHVSSALLSDSIDWRKYMDTEAGTAELSVDMNDVVQPGDELAVKVVPSSYRPAVTVKFTPTSGGEPLSEVLKRTADGHQGSFRLEPGTWRVTLCGEKCSPVTDLVVVAAEG